MQNSINWNKPHILGSPEIVSMFTRLMQFLKDSMCYVPDRVIGLTISEPPQNIGFLNSEIVDSNESPR